MRANGMRLLAAAVLSALLCLVAWPGQGLACTGIVIQSKDGAWVYARTMEFGADIVSFNLIAVGRGRDYSGTTPAGKPGLAWKVKYGHVGFNPFGMPLVADGINEKGLACGGFYLPGYAQYQEYSDEERSRTISNLDFVSWVLGSFARVAELRAALGQVRVVGAALAQGGGAPPLHYIVVDETGEALVIEYVDGRLALHECSVGVITNSPPYGWHLTNLRNYVGLSALNRPSVKIGHEQIAQIGQGSGAVGLPGDFTPPARFVRAAFLAHAAYLGENALETVLSSFRILNQFDIPRGAIRAEYAGRVLADATQWTSAADLRNRRYYFHTEYSRRVRVVDLAGVNLDGGRVVGLDVTSPEKVEDVSGDLK
ncbi:MAG: linear amide C-N hydrolase [Thermodesulfobacteriota bacterium]